MSLLTAAPVKRNIADGVIRDEQKTKTEQKNHDRLFAGLRVFGQTDGLCIIGELPRAQSK